MSAFSDRWALDGDDKLDVQALQRLYERVARLEEGALGGTSNSEGNVGWEVLTLDSDYTPGATSPRVAVHSGIVFLAGFAVAASDRPVGDTVLILPGYACPAYTSDYVVSMSTTGGTVASTGVIGVTPAGQMKVRRTLVTNDYVQLTACWLR